MTAGSSKISSKTSGTTKLSVKRPPAGVFHFLGRRRTPGGPVSFSALRREFTCFTACFSTGRCEKNRAASCHLLFPPGFSLFPPHFFHPHPAFPNSPFFSHPFHSPHLPGFSGILGGRAVPPTFSHPLLLLLSYFFYYSILSLLSGKPAGSQMAEFLYTKSITASKRTFALPTHKKNGGSL